MTENARCQVVEVEGGYAVRDTKKGWIVTKTYKHLGWAIRAALRENEFRSQFIYS